MNAVRGVFLSFTIPTRKSRYISTLVPRTRVGGGNYPVGGLSFMVNRNRSWSFNAQYLRGAILSCLNVLAEVLVRPARVSQVHDQHPNIRQLVGQGDQLVLAISLERKESNRTTGVASSINSTSQEKTRK